MKLFGETLALYKTHLSSEIHKRFGNDKVQEAFDYYRANMTAGKIIFRPDLIEKKE